MTRTVQINVTADVIAQQKRWRRNCERCPVAVAMSLALGWPVDVGETGWRFRDTGVVVYPLPRAVTTRINKLMASGQMAPFRFEVEIPA